MNLRKQRIHETGKSNLDFRSKEYTRPEIVQRIDFLATAKTRNIDQILKEKLQRTAPIPKKSFYDTDQLKLKPKAEVSHPRLSQLEEKELRKPVFTGESNTIFSTQTQQQVKIKQQEAEEEQLRDKLNNLQQKKEQQQEKAKAKALIDEKHDQNATAIAETQFVGFDQYNKQTLEGRVDLEKVREIRRAIRRRYANRTNFQKIFNQWDYNTQGCIKPQNAFEMIKKLGININFDECRVLIASSDQDQSGDLNLNEFMDLIFNSNDTLNVNLQSLPVLSEEEYAISTAENVVDKLNQDAIRTRTERHKNQLNLILQNKLSFIRTYTFAEDTLQQGFISYQKFKEVIKKLAIPETVLSNEDAEMLFNKHKIDKHQFDYRAFIDFLRNYQFVPEDIYVDPALTEKKKDEKAKLLTLFNYEENKKINVYDCHNVNSWHLETIRNQAVKVFRIIERYMSNKESFDHFLMQQMQIQDKNQFQNQQISKKNLTKAIENLLLNVGDKELKKEDVEAFLSIFPYNKHDHTYANDISKAIFDETDGQWFRKVAQKPNKPPPPQSIVYDEEYEKNIKRDQENIQFEQQAQQSNLIRKSTGLYYPKQLNQILQKFENQIFCGTQKAYDVFKKFDVDRDGYVSQKDLIQKIKELNILQNHEIQPLLQYLDPENKGYVNFNQFSSKIRVGMSNNDDMGKQLVIPFTNPSQEQLKDIQNMLPELQPKINELRSSYKPDEKPMKASRFNSTPKEEQLRKKQYELGRIQKIKDHHSKVLQQIEKQNQIDDIRNENKLKTKGLCQWTYEHRCHLLNSWN